MPGPGTLRSKVLGIVMRSMAMACDSSPPDQALSLDHICFLASGSLSPKHARRTRPLGVCSFLLLAQEKRTKEKGTPLPRFADFLSAKSAPACGVFRRHIRVPSENAPTSCRRPFGQSFPATLRAARNEAASLCRCRGAPEKQRASCAPKACARSALNRGQESALFPGAPLERWWADDQARRGDDTMSSPFRQHKDVLSKSPAGQHEPGGQDARRARKRGGLSFGSFSLAKQRK